MRPHPRTVRAYRLGAASAAALCVWLCASRAPAQEPARRIVSLNPSLTQILLALGARDRIVGVDDFSGRLQPEVAQLPRVGGLFNPSLEAIVALEPDLVVLVPSAEQRALREQLEGLEIAVLATPNVSLEELLASIEQIGARIGRAEAARSRVDELRRALASAPASAPRVRAVLVLQRDPLFIAGRGSFLDALLAAAGAQNLGAVFSDPYPRVADEWLLSAAPDVILDASDDPEPAARYWTRWPSLPAVAQGRVIALAASEITMPGPHLDRALRALRRALGGPEASGG